VTASFLALGDSYTIGEGVADDERWPVQLAARLRKAGVAIDDPLIVARTGWTTDELRATIGERHIGRSFDLVTLMAGVNDQYRGYGTVRFRESFELLLQSALTFAKLPGHLIVLSIPDWSVTPFATGRDRQGIAREIDAFNDVIRRMATTVGASCLDVSPISRQALNRPTLLAADGLHPSAAMYSMWVDQLEPMSIDALRAS
jgi:lysophospholipase L1-like esterase